jgi:hypothetical protein
MMKKPRFGLSTAFTGYPGHLGSVLALLLGGSAGLLSCNGNSLGTSADAAGTADMAAPFMGPYSDLPAAPVAAGGIMAGMVGAIATSFGSAMNNATGGPCISEPTFGALYPTNFTPPLIEWQPGTNQNVFELRFHVDNQVNDMLVYTDQSSYTMAASIWTGLTTDSADHDITITIRGGQLTSGQLMGAVSTGSSGSVHIAPVGALGAIVYWWIVPATSATGLNGFHIGDTTTTSVLSPTSITNAGDSTTCVGCHTSSPDGLLAFFGRASPSFSVDARQVNGSSGAPAMGQVTTNALTNLARTDQDLPTLSKVHYGPGDAVVITVMSNTVTSNTWQLIWTDLLATSAGTGILTRMNDTNGAATPSWSHDGLNIAYTSSNAVVDGRVDQGNGDIFIVPYNNRMGGAAAAVPGLNDMTNYNQYYPVFSPNDKFLAYNRNPRGTQMYNSPSAEIWVGPAAGGTPTRIAANDPPACTGVKSPGITNSWARWSPSFTGVNGKNYYWLVFSSTRRPMGNPQLFISALVTTTGPSGEVISNTYPAIYIPTQDPTQNNHTPAWDEFMIPIG